MSETTIEKGNEVVLTPTFVRKLIVGFIGLLLAIIGFLGLELYTFWKNDIAEIKQDIKSNATGIKENSDGIKDNAAGISEINGKLDILLESK